MKKKFGRGSAAILLGLCLLLAVAAPVSLAIAMNAADGVESKPDNDQSFASASVEEQYARIMKLDSKAQIQALLNELSPNRLAELEAYAQQADLEKSSAEEMQYTPPAAVNYTAAGPLLSPMSIPDEDDNGLILNKNAVPDGNGGYVITLEAYTTGTVTTETTSMPTDTILVLDQSGSMAYDFGSTTRQAAMKQAVTGFINSVAQNASENEVNHHIGIITYGSSSSTLSALRDVSAQENALALTQAVNALPRSPSGATRIDYGVSAAQTMFRNFSIPAEGRNRVVIVFTDGVPTSSSAFDTTVANSALSSANSMKAQGITVFTIGIFDGADPSELNGDSYNTLLGTTQCDGNVGSVWGYSTIYGWTSGDIEGYDVAAGNRFLNYISNNFQAPTSIGIDKNYSFGGLFGGDGWHIAYNAPRANDNYYLTASNSESLDKIFEEISNQIETPSIELDGTTVIRDIISPYFTLPQGARISLFESAFDGGEFGPRVSSEADYRVVGGNTIEITGFDFNANFVSETVKEDGTYGKKLIVEFTVNPQPGFFGGVDVPTNGSDSGVYSGGELIESFPAPTVDVPIRYGISARDLSVYLTQTADLGGILDYAEGFRPNGVNNAFVTITYMLRRGQDAVGFYNIPAGSAAGSWSVSAAELSVLLEEDTAYTLECEVTSGILTPWTGSKGATVHVFKPMVTFVDSVIYYGRAADYEDNLLGVNWLCCAANAEKPAGTAPALNYTFDPQPKLLSADTHVGVEVTCGGRNITRHTVLSNDREACQHENCAYDSALGAFMVHVKTCSLTITKSGASAVDAGQSFIMRVRGVSDTNSGIDLNVAVQGNGSITITGLPIGEYVVEEDEGWSWRYSAAAAGAELTDAAPHGTATVSNTRVFARWLDGDNWLNNLFGWSDKEE